MKIIALYVGQLTNAKHFTFMQFVLAALGQFHLLEGLFQVQAAALQAAFNKENEIFLKHNRNFLTPNVQDADTTRDKAFRALRDALKVVMLSADAEKVKTAEFLMGVIKDYGGARIVNMAVDAESGVLTNLVEDLQEKYPELVAKIALTDLVAELKAANENYIKVSADRTLDESQTDKSAMVKARKATDEAYRGLVYSINLHVQYNGDGDLLPFIKYLNTEIERYRIQLGIGVGKPGTDVEGEQQPGEEEQTPPAEQEPTTPPAGGDNRPEEDEEPPILS